MNAKEIVAELRKHSNPKNVAGMARFGINPANTLGVSIPIIRKMAKKIGRNHLLAISLWKTNVHEARILAALIDKPAEVSEKQMDSWAKDFDSWDVCDQACMNLFDKTPFAYSKAIEFAGSKKEFVKRAGFALMASLASHDKKAPDAKLEQFLPVIIKASDDERNFVRKAVNWALRQIGKRNPALNRKAVEAVKKIAKIDSKSARWIAADALRELQSAAVLARLKKA